MASMTEKELAAGDMTDAEFAAWRLKIARQRYADDAAKREAIRQAEERFYSALPYEMKKRLLPGG